jgi:hypothetical protein
MIDMPHQIATKAIGGNVYVAALRDPADGTTRFAPAYTFKGGAPWVSRHRFQEMMQAEAGCLALVEFVG